MEVKKFRKFFKISNLPVIILVILLLGGFSWLIIRYGRSLADMVNPPPDDRPGLEETGTWTPSCTPYSGTCTPAPAAYSTTIPNKMPSGLKSLYLVGDKKSVYKLSAPKNDLLPNKKYRVSFWSKVSNRTCFDSITEGGYQFDRIKLDDSHSLWCGKFEAYLVPSGTNTGLQIIPEQVVDYPYLRQANQDWTYNSMDFTTLDSGTQYTFTLRVSGFSGDLFIDSIVFTELGDDGFVSSADTVWPVTPSNMQITKAENNNVETSKARFTITSNFALNVYHKSSSARLSSINFPANFLTNLVVSQNRNGVAILSNNNVELSFGGDSTVIIRLKNPAAVSIKNGNLAPVYNFHKNGLVYTDYNNKGVMFTPLLGDGDFRYVATPDTALPSALVFWTENGDFNSQGWSISYNALKSDAFILSVFPPKDFDEQKFCKTSFNMMPNGIQKYTDSQLVYRTSRFTDFYNMAVLYMGDYSYTNDRKVSDPSLVSYFQPIGNKLMMNVDGPFQAKAGEEGKLRAYIEFLHAAGLKVVAYMSPVYYYSDSIDDLLANLSDNMQRYGFDGVYYDGVYNANPAKNLELARRTRELVDRLNNGHGLYIQHASNNPWFYQNSSNKIYGAAFRLPFIDAYADLVLVGEGTFQATPEAWKYAYSGMNISNSIFDIVLKRRDPSIGIVAQLQNGLSNWAQTLVGFWLNPYQGVYNEKDFSIKAYRQLLEDKCLSKTCNDDICDTGESIFTCSRDCAPIAADATLSRNSDGYVLNPGNNTLGNWIIDGQSLFKIHYNFEKTGVARDISGDKLNPEQNNITIVPAYDQNEAAYKFQNSTLTGNHGVEYSSTNGSVRDKILDLNDKNFAVFVKIKPTLADTKTNTIFSQGASHYSLSVRQTTAPNSLVEIAFYGKSGTKMMFVSPESAVLTNGSWHEVGFTYEHQDATHNIVRIYIDGAKVSEKSLTEEPKVFDDNVYHIGCDGTSATSTLCGANTFYNGYLKDLFVSIGDSVMLDALVKTLNDGNLLTYIGADGAEVKAIVVDGSGKYKTVVAPPPPPSLVGDLNNDGTVNPSDWAIMKGKWGSSDPVADLNNDGTVNPSDWAIMKGNWGKTNS